MTRFPSDAQNPVHETTELIDLDDRGHGEVIDAELATHPLRRRLLYCLYLRSNPLPLAEAADQLTVWETDPNSRGESYLQLRLEVYNALYHDHVPPLSDAGFVEYSQEDDMVELGPRGAAIEAAIKREYLLEITALLQRSDRRAEHDRLVNE